MLATCGMNILFGFCCVVNIVELAPKILEKNGILLKSSILISLEK